MHGSGQDFLDPPDFPRYQPDFDPVWVSRGLGEKILDDALKAHVHSYSDAGCEVCGTIRAHSCPESPDGYCHYRTVVGSSSTVLLRDGTTVELDEPVEPKYQSDDICFFCDEPDERK